MEVSNEIRGIRATYQVNPALKNNELARAKQMKTGKMNGKMEKMTAMMSKKRHVLESLHEKIES